MFGANVPEPPDQIPVVVPPLTEPPNPLVGPLEQIVWAPPVLTTDAGRIVTTNVVATALHGDTLPVEVSVNVTVPAESSATDGV